MSQWTLASARRFFDRAPLPLGTSVRSEDENDDVVVRELDFVIEAGRRGVATVVVPKSSAIERGVVVAHGGSDDGRRSRLTEAIELATAGAAVVVPATQLNLGKGAPRFVDDVRTAVRTQRAAIDLALELGAPTGELAFLGHSAGGALGAILRATEPRLTRIAISGNAAGPLARSALARSLSNDLKASDDVVNLAAGSTRPTL